MGQVFAVTAMNLRNVPQRWGASLVIVIGLAGVVAVFTALLAMAAGFEATLKSTGRADNALILRGGADSELNSGLERSAVALLRELPGIRRDAQDRPLVSAEVVVIAELLRKGEAQGESGANITLRGLQPAGFTLRPGLKVIEGRLFQPGLRELIVGRGVTRQYDGAKLGEVLRLRGSDWTIVGVFESGDAHDSELLADVEIVQTSFARNGFSSVLAGLSDADALAALDAAAAAEPRLAVTAVSEKDYFGSQTKQFRASIASLASAVTAIMALGAIFAALNTMYSAIDARAKEIATLRALGFGSGPVMLSVLIESLLLSLIGGALGALITYLLFDNVAVSTAGQNFTQIVFAFRVTPALLAGGLLIAMVIGLLGGLFPAVAAARKPIVSALRQL